MIIKTVYLAGPIMGATDQQANDWRERFTELWKGTVRNPMARDYRKFEQRGELSATMCHAIVQGDLEDIKACEALVADFTGQLSAGTCMELYHAKRAGKITVVISGQHRQLSPWVKYHADYTCQRLEDAVAFLSDWNTLENYEL